MFGRWDNFYLLIGGAAGSLIGLLFIVATLNRGRRDADSALRGASVFMTPIVLHLAVVLVISALAAAPDISAEAAALIVGAGGLVALVSAGRVIWHLEIARSLEAPHWTDVWCYGIAAFVADLALIGSAAAVWLATPTCAARGIAASLVAILLIAVRNAWDLVTWITAKGPAVGGEEE
ncbi:MAG: hypothetical protein JWP73_2528 [Phenylobacterium sp.]|nr:hypothetical protein [Phenylobacterium sp.]